MRHEIKIDDDTTVSVRRCYADDGDGELLCVAMETYGHNSFAETGFNLTPRKAIEFANAILQKAVTPISEEDRSA